MRASAALAVAVTALLACSQSPMRAPDADAEADKDWREIEARIPAYPRSENLVGFDADPSSPHRFYIDAPSLSIGADGVVRYTLVVRTAGGATSVSFEGIRCEVRRQKYYAVGNADGTWAPARDPHWRRIAFQDPDRRHLALVNDYLCADRAPLKTREVLQRLKRGPGEYQF
jgi:CNP1-like family protein